jgi:hypothetical protein
MKKNKEVSKKGYDSRFIFYVDRTNHTGKTERIISLNFFAEPESIDFANSVELAKDMNYCKSLIMGFLKKKSANFLSYANSDNYTFRDSTYTVGLYDELNDVCCIETSFEGMYYVHFPASEINIMQLWKDGDYSIRKILKSTIEYGNHTNRFMHYFPIESIHSAVQL